MAFTTIDDPSAHFQVKNWVSTNTIYDGTLFKFQIILLSPEEIQFKACKG